ncbi:ABC transporter ATP-binding protein [Ectobacillus sp. JY-23]|uniref:ABC transporter ATP-binding protein n=1 Tax=Ectobacillus sp. JY-23 TaxID=2933872 RepID=UPI001FF3D0F8|nr:ABC transporter ATP-binding protein [Ectobacillus sp. JY-23]UOY91538.1 ABC transporter ATP-binding protein [Ectobacillus sp. JY-23]
MLVVRNLTKSFAQKEAVKDISFSIGKGEAFGLLGPNGAGKSTTISMICGLLPYDGGDIRIGDISVKEAPMQVKRKIGVVPQEIALYPTMSARDNLIFWGKMYGLYGKEVKKRADEVLEYVGLYDRAKDKVETFSGGMKRRVNIGAALMHTPELLIMDEPTVGIDPQSRNHILETVKALNEDGMTVIYTSHYMEEVEYLCKRIAVVDHGKLIVQGTKSELCNRLANGIVIGMKVNHMQETFVQELKALHLVERVVTNVEEQSFDIFVSSETVIGDVIACTARHGVRVLALEVREPNLEALFLQLTGRSLRD